MRTTFLRLCFALEITLFTACAQSPIVDELYDPSDSDDPVAETRADAGSGKDAGKGSGAGSGSGKDAAAAKDADKGIATGEDASSDAEEEEEPPAKDAGRVKDASAPRDAALTQDSGTSLVRDASAVADARVSEPRVDASTMTTRDASVPDSSTSQPNQCVAQECPPCLLLATACCNSSNKCACRIGIGPCTLPAL